MEVGRAVQRRLIHHRPFRLQPGQRRNQLIYKTAQLFGTFGFSPDLQNTGSAGDGVALFDVPAASITGSTVPVDAVIYGPNNNNGLIDERPPSQSRVSSIGFSPKTTGCQEQNQHDNHDKSWRVQNTESHFLTKAHRSKRNCVSRLQALGWIQRFDVPRPLPRVSDSPGPRENVRSQVSNEGFL